MHTINVYTDAKFIYIKAGSHECSKTIENSYDVTFRRISNGFFCR